MRKLLGDNDLLAYLTMMSARMVELHRVLKPTGSLYLHCDPTASHYLKLLLDAVFGPEHFRSEIIWRRTSSHNDLAQGRRQHGRIHDVLLFYSRGQEWTWNPVYVAYDPDYVAKKYPYPEPGTNRNAVALGSTGGSGHDHHGLAWRLGRLRPKEMAVALEWEVAHLAFDHPRQGTQPAWG